MRKKAEAELDDMDNKDEEYEKSIDSSFCSESQMSLSAVSSNSDSIIHRIGQLNMKLEALKSSYAELEFKVKARVTKLGIDSDQYRSFLQKIEEKKLEIVSINQIIMYKKSLMVNQMIILL